MTNWKEYGVPFENFTEEITQEWIDKGFGKEECERWLTTGLRCDDASFVFYLKKRGFFSQIIGINLAWLREEYDGQSLRRISIEFNPEFEAWISNLKNNKEEYKKYLEEVTEGSKLGEEIIKQIKDFYHKNLTSEQVSLINKLIPNLELNSRYKAFGLCQECQQPNTSEKWCQDCNAKHFQQDFDKWSSGNTEIDESIQKCQLNAVNHLRILEWIPYEKFTGINHLATGGFSEVYKAIWIEGSIVNWENNKWQRNNKWKRENNKKVVLKSLKNSRNITKEFLQEVIFNKLFDDSNNIVSCFGISQDSQTGNYLMVMEYVEGGNLRKYLDDNYGELSFKGKIEQLRQIAHGIKWIHKEKLIHRDLHSGNILVFGSKSYITDLGLCRPVNEEDKTKVYGILPYIAPEVLRNQPYTQASDIYSFGIIAYEIFSELPPYHEFAHDEFLAVKICQGLRPNLNGVEALSLSKDLISKCWDVDPKKRPSADELYETFHNWHNEIINKNDTEFLRHYRDAFFCMPNNDEVFFYQTHPQAIYTSCLLNFKNLPEPINSQKTNEIFYKITEELESLRITDTVKFSKELQKKFKELEVKEEENGKKMILIESEEIPPIEIKTGIATKMDNLLVRVKRQLSFSISSQNESLLPSKSTKLTELGEKEPQTEPMEIDDDNQNQDWSNIHSSFTPEIIQEWQNLNFTYSQTQDWINIGLHPADYNFCSWLRDTKCLTPEQTLNHYNLEQLNQEFFNWWQERHQVQIEQLPKIKGRESFDSYQI